MPTNGVFRMKHPLKVKLLAEQKATEKRPLHLLKRTPVIKPVTKPFDLGSLSLAGTRFGLKGQPTGNHPVKGPPNPISRQPPDRCGDPLINGKPKERETSMASKGNDSMT